MSGNKKGKKLKHLLSNDDFHRDVIRSLHYLRSHENFTDVTFYCEGGTVQAHKAMLVPHSSVLREMFELSAKIQNSATDTVIILPEVERTIMLKIVNFIYQGQSTLKTKYDHEMFRDLAKLFNIQLDLEPSLPEDPKGANRPVGKKSGKKSDKGDLSSAESIADILKAAPRVQSPERYFGLSERDYNLALSKAEEARLGVKLRNCARDPDTVVKKAFNQCRHQIDRKDESSDLLPNPLFGVNGRSSLDVVDRKAGKNTPKKSPNKASVRTPNGNVKSGNKVASAKVEKKVWSASGSFGIFAKAGGNDDDDDDMFEDNSTSDMENTTNEIVMSEDEGNNAPSDSDDDSYVIEKVLDKKGHGAKLLYLVRWKGYGEDGDTWEPVANLDKAMDLVDEYEKQKGSGTPSSNKSRSTSPVETDTEKPEEDASQEDEERVIMCNLCMRIFMTVKALDNHVAENHSENVKTEKNDRKRKMSEEVVMTVKKGPQDKKRNVSGKPTTPKLEKKSKSQDTPSSELICFVCNKSLLQKHLRDHVVLHFNSELRARLPLSKPFSCPLCSAVSSSLHKLTYHYAFVHKEILKYCTEEQLSCRSNASKASAVKPGKSLPSASYDSDTSSPSPVKQSSFPSFAASKRQPTPEPKLSASFSDSDEDEIPDEAVLRAMNVTKSFDELLAETKTPSPKKTLKAANTAKIDVSDLMSSDED